MVLNSGAPKAVTLSLDKPFPHITIAKHCNVPPSEAEHIFGRVTSCKGPEPYVRPPAVGDVERNPEPTRTAQALVLCKRSMLLSVV